MTLTLFSKTRHRGRSASIQGDIANLGETKVDKPSSLNMSSRQDAALFFKNDDWKGGVYYARGFASVPDLGSPKFGGRRTFGNSIRSVRITPFRLDLNITLVLNGIGELPSAWKNEDEAKKQVRACIKDANKWLKGQRALLKLRIARTTCRKSNGLFQPNAHAPIPSKWRERGEVDLVFCHSFRQEGALGVARFPCLGRHIKVAAMITGGKNGDAPAPQNLMTETVLHELGHFLGLQHRTAKGLPRNIMCKSPDLGINFEARSLSMEQIREMHQRLARNISRRGDRK